VYPLQTKSLGTINAVILPDSAPIRLDTVMGNEDLPTLRKSDLDALSFPWFAQKKIKQAIALVIEPIDKLIATECSLLNPNKNIATQIPIRLTCSITSTIDTAKNFSLPHKYPRKEQYTDEKTNVGSIHKTSVTVTFPIA
jgi:hypothetical protein